MGILFIKAKGKIWERDQQQPGDYEWMGARSISSCVSQEKGKWRRSRRQHQTAWNYSTADTTTDFILLLLLLLLLLPNGALEWRCNWLCVFVYPRDYVELKGNPLTLIVPRCGVAVGGVESLLQFLFSLLFSGNSSIRGKNSLTSLC